MMTQWLYHQQVTIAIPIKRGLKVDERLEESILSSQLQLLSRLKGD